MEYKGHKIDISLDDNFNFIIKFFVLERSERIFKFAPAMAEQWVNSIKRCIDSHLEILRDQDGCKPSVQVPQCDSADLRKNLIGLIKELAYAAPETWNDACENLADKILSFFYNDNINHNLPIKFDLNIIASIIRDGNINPLHRKDYTSFDELSLELKQPWLVAADNVIAYLEEVIHG